MQPNLLANFHFEDFMSQTGNICLEKNFKGTFLILGKEIPTFYPFLVGPNSKWLCGGELSIIASFF